MKIVVLGTRGFPDVQGGIEKHCEELFTRIVALGHDVTVITRTPYIPKNNRKNSYKGVKFLHLWCPRKKSFEAIIHSFLGVIVARFKSPDVLHIHGVGPSLLVPFAKLLGLKVVMTHHGPDYERQKWGKLAKYILRKGESFGVRFADKVIVISNIIRNSVEKLYSVKNTAVLYNGITTPSIITPDGTLSRYNLKQYKYIFTACRFVPEKGLHDLINAYAEIPNPDFKLVIAGDADHESDYSRSLKQLAKEKGVILTGYTFGKELGELFSNAGLFVLPSYYEGLPIALLEAMSYNIPVLISDIPQHKEVNLDNKRYFRLGDIEDLKAKIVQLISEGISEKEKSEFNHLIREKYNWDTIALDTIKLYKEII
ncbi:MAG: glycosyltransferase family 4 protein [Ignavibacteria bacterium]|jgi:glycosyltransferase involved in cell wall biosynthesis|nr:glycosyltransferase family 4 protein [Ignavibacteria bacterium]MCU7503734.1 glycosyltransferase family 4 protein [Ignavibacteria bacterium]MCU7517620.1 glycosyltransferase family 4 protein [Ignavibacteria bacterium]